MQGNVLQWCEDLWEKGGSDRVFRGGGWYDDGQRCRAAFRDSEAPARRGYGLGFRLARVPVR
jgi:formylglycine-generating enzyme